MALRMAGVGRVIVSDLSSTCRMALSFIGVFHLYRTSNAGPQGGMRAGLTVAAD
jgi:hypothetical protein